MVCKMRMFFCVVATVLVCSSVTGAVQGDYSGGLLDREAVLQAAKEVTREVYPNADEVLVDDFILVR